jgi:hypothetical protein
MSGSETDEGIESMDERNLHRTLVPERRSSLPLMEKKTDLSAFSIHESQIVSYSLANDVIIGVYHESNDGRGNYSMEFKPCVRQTVLGDPVIINRPVITHNFMGVMSPIPYETLDDYIADIKKVSRERTKKA